MTGHVKNLLKLKRNILPKKDYLLSFVTLPGNNNLENVERVIF